MSEEKLRVVCPNCKTVMMVDPETGIVIHRTGEKERPSLDDMLKSQKDKEASKSDRFAEAVQKEKERKSLIEDKFRAALENVDNLEDPTRPFDLD